MPGKIIQLPDSVANQIAAGEVVERPVAVVKELVENALDAGARAVDVQFERGGKSLIRVVDDGSGMSREDALLALRRHATSKIRQVEDILAIQSFGFRGEALPSIASVSKFLLKTRLHDEAEGTEIRLAGGREPSVRSCGMSPGTEVRVASLFHSVPARRKFLKTDRTESAHIIQMCRLLAVAHPEVAFSLVEDGHEVFRSPACPDRAQRVREIFGKRRMEDLIPIGPGEGEIRLAGLVGRPGAGRSTRSEMVTFVNDRPVDSRLLNYALIESYHRYLPRGRYPLAFLFVTLPPEEVDVNVHPTKREVRFRNEPKVRSAVMNTLTGILAEISRERLRNFEPVTPDPPGPETAPPRPDPARLPARREREPFPEPVEQPPAAAPREPPPRPQPEQRVWSFRGILRTRIGLFESADGLVLLNGRAARERVLFERIEGSMEGTGLARQSLLLPAMLELPPLDAGVLTDQLAFLDSLGFTIEPFGRHLFRIRSVPAWLHGGNPEAFVGDLVNRMRERGLRPDDAESARSHIARLGAIREARGYTPGSGADWEALARSLLACENPLLDARGKPTFIEMRHAELARKLMLDSADAGLDGLDGGG